MRFLGALKRGSGLSLRARLIILGMMMALVVAIGLVVAALLVNSGARAVLANTVSQLHDVAGEMARDYGARARYTSAHGYGSPLAEADAVTGKINPLAITAGLALRGYPRTEGGFYSAARRAVVGYAFPTYEGTGAKTDVPQAELPTIVEICEEAISTGQASTRTAGGEIEAVVFVATPLREGAQTTGAAWVMRRIHDVRGEAQRANLAFILLLALATLVTLGFGFVTVRGLRRGVESIETGLGRLEGDLGFRVKSGGQPELERIASAVNRLAANLQENISRQRGLEAELRRSEKLSALGRLVAGVAHEVRNPLGSMKLKLQLCRRAGLPPEKVGETFDVLEAEINRLDALVRRLLDLGRPRELRREACDLCSLVEERAGMFAELAANSRIEIETSCAARPLAVEVDRELIAELLDNLIANAFEAMRGQGGSLTLVCGPEAAGARAFVTVADTGRGVPEEEAEKIFEPFYTKSERGVGLGLAIAREFAEAHGGRLSVKSGPGKSEPGRGAAFTLELPTSIPTSTNAEARNSPVSP
jgi:signal transduction histidine kinase